MSLSSRALGAAPLGPSLLLRARDLDSPVPLQLPRAAGPTVQRRAWEEPAMLAPTQDAEQVVERIAALDIGKAELGCCVRVPDVQAAGQRLQDCLLYTSP